jgi:hypothetical protein
MGKLSPVPAGQNIGSRKREYLSSPGRDEICTMPNTAKFLFSMYISRSLKKFGGRMMSNAVSNCRNDISPRWG